MDNMLIGAKVEPLAYHRRCINAFVEETTSRWGGWVCTESIRSLRVETAADRNQCRE